MNTKRIVTKGLEGLVAMTLVGAVLVGGMGAAQAKDTGWDQGSRTSING